LLTILGCDDKKPSYARQSEILSIEDQNTSLKDQLEELKATVATLSAQLAEVRSVYQVHNGDAVIEGANLHIRSGHGETECFPLEECNGKGNLIIGYNEPRHECVDSNDEDGSPCSIDEQCSGGTCEPIARPYRTGSHNLVVGPGHSYTGFGGVVLGSFSSTEGRYASVLGGGNNTAMGDNAVVVGGSLNTASGWRDVVVGGDHNTTAGRTNVVVGGFENATADVAHSSVVLGHHGHESTSSGEIAPDIQSVQRPWEGWKPPEEPQDGQ
jgi:hypothetical protein